MGVFLNHAAIYQTYLRDGIWRTDAAVFMRLGQLGVSLFFMITAYLFYGRLIVENGRPDWVHLYLGRLFRIGPVYLVAIAAMFAIVAVESDFRLRVGGWELCGQIASWLALGAGPRVDLNGFPDTRHLLAGVTWTLQAEWLFYASLPVLALAARSALRLVIPVAGFVGVLALLTIFTPEAFPACLGPFLAGMVCAALPRRLKASHNIASGLAVGVFGVILAGVSPRAPVAILMIGGAFYLFVSGCSVFRLLTCRLVCWLGSISYGVYLLHGLVLSKLATIGPVRAFGLASPGQFLIFAFAAAISTLLAAHLVNVLIEKPGIDLGRWVAGWLHQGQELKTAGRRCDSLMPDEAQIVDFEPAAYSGFDSVSPRGYKVDRIPGAQDRLFSLRALPSIPGAPVRCRLPGVTGGEPDALSRIETTT